MKMSLGMNKLMNVIYSHIKFIWIIPPIIFHSKCNKVKRGEISVSLIGDLIHTTWCD